MVIRNWLQSNFQSILASRMIKELYRLRIIIFLVITIIVLSVVKIRYGWKGETETWQTEPNQKTVLPTITSEPTKTATTPAVLQVDEEKYPLWDRLPYPGEGFVVKRYSAPKVLYVTLDGATTTSATKAINVWLDGFGGLGKGHKLEFEELNNE